MKFSSEISQKIWSQENIITQIFTFWIVFEHCTFVYNLKYFNSLWKSAYNQIGQTYFEKCWNIYYQQQHWIIIGGFVIILNFSKALLTLLAMAYSNVWCRGGGGGGLYSTPLIENSLRVVFVHFFLIPAKLINNWGTLKFSSEISLLNQDNIYLRKVTKF